MEEVNQKETNLELSSYPTLPVSDRNGSANENGSHSMDPLKLKRAMTSKEYSRNYRLKRFQHLMKLEKQMESLQAEVIVEGPMIKYSEEQNLLLRAENNLIKEKLAAAAAQLMFKEAQYRELKRERDAMMNFLREYLKQCPELLENLNPRTIQMLHFMLNQSGSSVESQDEIPNRDDHDDQMPSCSDPTVDFGAGEANPEHEILYHQFID